MKIPSGFAPFGQIYSTFGAPHFINQLSEFEKYVAFVQRELKSEIGKTDRKLQISKKDIKAKKIPAEQVEYMRNFFRLEYSLVGTFKKLLIDSSIIQLFSMIEIELNNICNGWFEFHPETYQVKEIKGKDSLHIILIYLTKSVKVNKKLFESPEWKFIENLRIVRNKLVHREGIITKAEYNEIKGITLVKEGKIQLQNYGPDDFIIIVPNIDFVLEGLGAVSKFYKEFICALENLE